VVSQLLGQVNVHLLYHRVIRLLTAHSLQQQRWLTWTPVAWFIRNKLLTTSATNVHATCDGAPFL